MILKESTAVQTLKTFLHNLFVNIIKLREFHTIRVKVHLIYLLLNIYIVSVFNDLFYKIC